MSTGGSASGSATPSSQQAGAGSTRADTPSLAPSHLRNEIGSPTSAGSENDFDAQSINSGFAPGVLASKLGRSLTGAGVGSTWSLSGSGTSSPSLALTGFNAISTVLNNPSKRQHPIDPKSSRFPPLTLNPHALSDIPKAKKADLEGYLSSVRPEWDRFMRNQKLGREGKARIGDDVQDQGSDQGQRLSEVSSAAYPNAISRETRGHRARGSVASLSADLRAQPATAPKKRLPPLSAVPHVFFSEDFDLGQPYTFDLVTERYKATASSTNPDGSAAPSYDVALNQMLQEKLSYYSDVIEQHLIIEIGQQSSSFFAALGNLKELNSEAETCLEKIERLKAELVDIDEGQAKQGLRVVQEQDRRRQLHGKRRAIESVREVIERRDLARLLVQQGETEEALEVIDGLRQVLTSDYASSVANGTQPKNYPLRFADLQSLSPILPQLKELESSLSGSLQQDLLAILAEDLATRAKKSPTSFVEDGSYFTEQPSSIPAAKDSLGSPAVSTPLSSTPVRPSSSPFGTASKPLIPSDAQLRARIAPLIGGLTRTGGIDGLASSYRETALQAVKDTWRAILGGEGEPTAELAAYLESEDPSKKDLEGAPETVIQFRDVEHATFLSLGRRLFDALLQCLRAVDSQAKLMIRILDEYHAAHNGGTAGGHADSDRLSDASGPASVPTMPDGVSPTLPTAMADVVTACTELSHVLTARLISIRSSTHTTMELASFLAVFQLCWSYVLSSELVCRKMIVGLRGSVLSQAKGFLSQFHRKRIERAAKAVEEETWAQSDVAADVQREVRLIVESAVEDPPSFVISGDPSRTLADPSSQAAGATKEEATTAEPGKALEIEDRSYFVVAASLDVLRLLGDYLRLIINLPLLTTEAMGRVVEFLKQFNSRTCQVVLGAGAMRSAGLKNITAKHLALASQSLSIIISLIPYVRETVRRHLSPKQAVMLTEFDKLRRDLQEHQYEIHAKLVAIMSDRLTVHCRTLGTVDWNAPLSEGQDPPVEANKYAADLVKETATLHKVLSKYLQPPVVEHVIGQVLRSIDVRLAAELEKVDVQTLAARRRLEEDVGLLEKKLSALKHVEWKGENLSAVLDQKQMPDPAQSVGKNEKDSEPSSKGDSQPAIQHAYKPRIPSLFNRRQQQQQQQSQPQQNGAARSSVESTTPAAASQNRASHENAPRSSMQDVATPPVPGKEGGESAREAETVSQGDGVSADGQGQQPSATMPAAPPTPAKMVPPDTSPTAEAEAGSDLTQEPVPTLPGDGSATQDEESPSATLQQTPEAKSDEGPSALPTATQADPAPSSSVDPKSTEQEQQASQTTAEASTVATADEAPLAAEVTTVAEDPVNATAPSSPPLPSDAASTVTAPVPDTSSPARSGASTPASVNGTPVKSGRMSLKERLAEAARKRMMAQQVSVPAIEPAAVPLGQSNAPDSSAVEKVPAQTEQVATSPAAPTTPAEDVAPASDETGAEAGPDATAATSSVVPSAGEAGAEAVDSPKAVEQPSPAAAPEPEAAGVTAGSDSQEGKASDASLAAGTTLTISKTSPGESADAAAAPIANGAKSVDIAELDAREGQGSIAEGEKGPSSESNTESIEPPSHELQQLDESESAAASALPAVAEKAIPDSTGANAAAAATEAPLPPTGPTGSVAVEATVDNREEGVTVPSTQGHEDENADEEAQDDDAEAATAATKDVAGSKAGGGGKKKKKKNKKKK